MGTAQRTVVEDMAVEVRRRAMGHGTALDLRNYLDHVVIPDLAVREEMVTDLECGIVHGVINSDDEDYLMWREERDILRSALARGERGMVRMLKGRTT